MKRITLLTTTILAAIYLSAAPIQRAIWCKQHQQFESPYTKEHVKVTTIGN